mgnify:CR=1 FL=1
MKTSHEKTQSGKILLGVTGSVAAKLTEKMLNELPIEELVVTQSALMFLPYHLQEVASVESDERIYYATSNAVYHIDLIKKFDLLLIAPLTANTLAKIANGLCDNLLTNIVRAWPQDKPVVICPAMNVHMWNHPLTKKHLDVCKELGYTIVEPIEKELFCKDVGVGAMARIETIKEVVNNVLGKT